ncbi:MAG: helix-turn-helix transcriptional regulator [Rhodothermales bacterium]
MEPFNAEKSAQRDVGELIKSDIEALEFDPEFMAEEVLLDVNEQICMLMNHEDIQRSTLAKRLGWSRGAVSKMLNGNHNISIRRLAEVASALGVKLLPPRFVAIEEHEMVMPDHMIFYAKGDGGTRLRRTNTTTTNETRQFVSLTESDLAA